MTTSDWVLIVTTLFLGTVAIVAPYLSNQVKKRFLSPELSLGFRLEPPMCRKASRFIRANPNLREPFFDFHFQLTNVGKTKAKEVEAVLQELWVYDAGDNPRQLPDFSPVNLRYNGADNRFVDLNPNRPVFWNIGNVPSPAFQSQLHPDQIVDVPGKTPGQDRFFFDLAGSPFFQPNSLLPGKYRIKVIIYSENADRIETRFDIVWTGKWRDEEEEMFRELVIEQD